MATTEKGYPYPVGTDRVADGDNAIQSLAESVDTHLGRAAVGQLTLTIPGDNSSVTVPVTFPTGRFSGAPMVLANISNNVPAGSQGYAFAWASSVTAQGFTMNARSTRSGATRFDWIAVQV